MRQSSEITSAEDPRLQVSGLQVPGVEHISGLPVTGFGHAERSRTSGGKVGKGLPCHSSPLPNSEAPTAAPAKRLLSEFLGKKAYEEQYQYLCETTMPRGMKVSDWIDRLEVMIERLPLIDRMADKLCEREAMHKVITPNTSKARKKGQPFERRRYSQDPESVQINLEDDRESVQE